MGKKSQIEGGSPVFTSADDAVSSRPPSLNLDPLSPLSQAQHHHPKSMQDVGDGMNQRDVMIRGIAHDVNNNLMAIMAACDHLETRDINVIDFEVIISSIRTHIKSATTLMRDLVNNENMDKQVVMTKDELEAFLTSILPSFSLISGEKTQIELGSVITPPVHVHPLLLHRVLLQLVRNVDDLDVKHPLAYISVRKTGRWCEVSVSDNGKGLQQINSKDVFNPGVTSKDNSGARGYGLSAVAWAVNSWGGEYGVEAIKGDNGCRFWVRLALVED
ncbi:MAG: ATP-binding protein [Candidatus Puniceispirillales bacterium WSBS_2018_MAG_OTU23]